MGNKIHSTEENPNKHLQLEIGKKMKDQKFYGLNNICNNCYVNSFVQAFNNCSEFKKKCETYRPPQGYKYIKKKQPDHHKDTDLENPEQQDNYNVNKIQANPVAKISNAFRQLKGKEQTGVESVQDFMNYIKNANEMFNNEMHQDIHEFLLWFLNQIDDQLIDDWKEEERREKAKQEQQGVNYQERKVGETWIKDLFGVTTVDQIICTQCNKKSETKETNFGISLDLVDNYSLMKLFDLYQTKEKMDGENKYFCSQCKEKQVANKILKIEKLPNLLLIQLKRFKYTENGGLEKIKSKIYFTLQFNISLDQTEIKTYELISVIVHHGEGINTGHYTALVKKQHFWFEYNDKIIQQVSIHDIYKLFGDPRYSAYILMYQLKK